MELALLIGFLGLFIGSFLRSLVYRLHTGKPFFLARSVCPTCLAQIRWFDNLPIVGYLFLRGRCRACQVQIPVSYVLAEIGTGLLFFFTVLLHEKELLFFSGNGIVGLVVVLISVSALIAVFLSDFLYMEIPSGITLVPATVIAVLQLVLLPNQYVALAVALLLGAGFFGVQYILSRGRWIGGGDVRFGFLMGAILGWPLVIAGLFLSYIIGGVIAAPLLLFKKKKVGDQFPFGTVLAIATFVTLFVGSPLTNWYFSLLFE